MPVRREYYHDRHNIMKIQKAPEIAADPAATATRPPEPDANPVSEKTGQGWVPRDFIADRNGR